MVAKLRSWVLCAKSVFENGVLGPQKGQISPRGPTMVGRGVCSPRGLASESGPRICYKHQFGLYKGKMALRHLTNRTTHFHLNPVGVKIHAVRRARSHIRCQTHHSRLNTHTSQVTRIRLSRHAVYTPTSDTRQPTLLTGIWITVHGNHKSMFLFVVVLVHMGKG